MTTPTNHHTGQHRAATTMNRLLVLAEREGHAVAAREIHDNATTPRGDLDADRASFGELIPIELALDAGDGDTLHTRYQAAYYAAWELQLTPDNHDNADDADASPTADSDTTAATPVDGDTTHTTA